MSEPDRRDRVEIIADLVEARKQIFDLREELALNAAMLAKQCDLARDAETEAARLRERLRELEAANRALREMLSEVCANAHFRWMRREKALRERAIALLSAQARTALAKTAEPK